MALIDFKDPITAGIGLVSGIIDRIFPDPAERDRAKLELLKQQQAGALDEFRMLFKADEGQIAVNQTEAASGSGGWRWGAGWLCVVSLGYSWILRDLVVWLMTWLVPHVPPIPPVNAEAQYGMLMGMLGLGGIRAYDLAKGSRK